MKKILLVDDHEMIREAIKHYLDGVEEFQITAEAENGKVAFQLMLERAFDLVITDINMPVVNGLELVENIRLNFPGQLILALTMEASYASIKKLSALGVQGYVLKNVRQEEFVWAIQQIFSHQPYFSQEIRKELDSIKDAEMNRLSKNAHKSLSEIEQRVLKLLMNHALQAEISRELNISPRVLDLLLKNLYRKANCKSIPGLIIYGIEKGLI